MRKIWFVLPVLIFSVFIARAEIERTGEEDVEREEQLILQRKVKSMKEAVRRSRYLDTLNYYLALRHEDSGFCTTESCRQKFINFIPLRYIAEGRCRELTGLSKELCEAIRRRNCDLEPVPMFGDFCRAILEGDANALLRVGESSSFRREMGGNLEKDGAHKVLALYEGFRSYSVIACERRLRGAGISLSVQLICPVVFAYNPQEVVDGLVEDLAYFEISRQENNLNLCELIDNGFVRDNCLDPGVRDLIDVW